MSTSKFRYSPEPEPHKARTKQILSQYPQVRNLIGKNPFTIIPLVGIVLSMIVISYLLKDSSWWLVFLVAYTYGAFANHALFVMIHECSHNLLFKGKVPNYIASMTANLPHILPSAISFTRYHRMHHVHQGNHDLDADLPDFCRKIKEAGFLVKLDTNGRDPKLLQKIIDENLVDYIAMDVKHTWEKYPSLV